MKKHHPNNRSERMKLKQQKDKIKNDKGKGRPRAYKAALEEAIEREDEHELRGFVSQA